MTALTRVCIDVIVILVMLGTVFGAAAQRRRQPRNVAKVQLEAPRHDFGEVFAGETVSTMFMVRNAGNAPLELSEKPAQPAKPQAARAGYSAPPETDRRARTAGLKIEPVVLAAAPS